MINIIFNTFPQRSVKILGLLSIILVAGCSAKLADNESGNFFRKLFSKDTYSIYRIDIQQGNALTREQIKKLKPGLTKVQVRYLLGLPIATTLFHDDRWDYTYSFISGANSTRVRYNVTLFFKEDKLVKVRKSRLPEKLKRSA